MTKCIADIMAPWVFVEPDPEIPDYDAHWHRYRLGHDDWISIYADNTEFIDNWEVEVYPSPDFDEKRKDRHIFDTKEEAAQYVAEFMEDH